MTVVIDGSLGEGGGQVLRTSLSLSAVTGIPLRINNIRANRSQPGLKHQHLTAVKAAAAICKADLEGAHLGSTSISFQPGAVQGGRYHFSIPTAGSAPLVLQTVFYPLVFAERDSTVTVQGGTHVRWSPCFHYLERQWLPYLKQMGYRAGVTLNSAGYYPKGGGELTARIQSGAGKKSLQLTQRGDLVHVRGEAAVTDLPDHITRRMRDRVVSRVGHKFPLQDIRTRNINGPDKGAFIFLSAVFEHATAGFCALGERGKRAEIVADEAIDQVLNFLDGNGCVDRYVADQLLIPLAIAQEQSSLKVSNVTSHLVTNALIIQEFLPVDFDIQGEIGKPGTILVDP